ncbi:MAG TPA: GNAT family N-acetyltransferase [Candidatus Nanoarchaeia archaeon]|nr:GNAT family N-acetyltransferase [Candidatus Nanoarchaeia archaeon]
MTLELDLNQPLATEGGFHTASRLELIADAESKPLASGINKIKAAELTAGQQRSIWSLVRESLGEILKKNYFEGIAAKDATVYYSENFEGIAIAYNTPFGAYLDIFAVKPKKQRNGIGKKLFAAVADEMGPELFLRTQSFRPAREFYEKNMGTPITFKNCDGTGYLGFFKGMSPVKIEGGKKYMENKSLNYESSPLIKATEVVRHFAHGISEKAANLTKTLPGHAAYNPRPY